MSEEAAWAVCFVLAYIIALIGAAASAIKKPKDHP